MNRSQLLKRLATAWGELKESYAGLSEKQMTKPGVVGDWAVKDMLAHISTWEQEALKYLPDLIEDKPLPRYSNLYGGLDAFNALMAEQKRALSLTEVLKQMDETHERLISYVMSVPEEFITKETRFRRRLRLDTYSHYPEHTQAIRAWRDRSD